MVNDLRWLLSQIDFSAAFDILLVASIIHIIFTIVRGTLADQLVRGIAVLLVFAFIIGNTLQLLVFDWLLRSVLSALVIAIPIIFQPGAPALFGASRPPRHPPACPLYTHK